VLAEVDGFWALREQHVPDERYAFDVWGPSIATPFEFGPQVEQFGFSSLDGPPCLRWGHGSHGSWGFHLGSLCDGWLSCERSGAVPGRACVP
jgi:hypothetical protein